MELQINVLVAPGIVVPIESLSIKEQEEIEWQMNFVSQVANLDVDVFETDELILK